MVLNFPAPHGPEDAHPDYRHYYDEPSLEQQSILTAHRELVFNRTSWQPGEKHWFLTSQKDMTEVRIFLSSPALFRFRATAISLTYSSADVCRRCSQLTTESSVLSA